MESVKMIWLCQLITTFLVSLDTLMTQLTLHRYYMSQFTVGFFLCA